MTNITLNLENWNGTEATTALEITDIYGEGHTIGFQHNDTNFVLEVDTHLDNDTRLFANGKVIAIGSIEADMAWMVDRLTDVERSEWINENATQEDILHAAATAAIRIAALQ